MSCEVGSKRSCDRYSQYGTCCMDMKRGQHGSDSFICVALITIFLEKLAWIKCCPRSMSAYKIRPAGLNSCVIKLEQVKC